jgi:tripartite-type tricarboxylate transporter receptor subunit TctC
MAAAPEKEEMPALPPRAGRDLSFVLRKFADWPMNKRSRDPPVSGWQALPAGLCAIAALCALIVGPDAALADSYPSAPVRVIVSYPPGGTSDLVARVLAQNFTERLGQSFFVENRPGAGGQIGTEIAAKSTPDGYTVYAAASGPIIFLPALARTLPYDTFRDFEMIGNFVTVPNIMIVHRNAPFNTLSKFIATAKAEPGRLRFGSAGIGSSGYLAGELLKDLAGIDIQHVPYRGSGPALTDLIAGRIDVMFENLPSALSHVREGSLVAVAVLSNRRSPNAPDLPTTAELGYPDFVIDSSTGMLAPKGTPPDILAVLAKALSEFVADRGVQGRLTTLGADLDFMSTEQYRTYIHNEIGRWSAIAKRANIRLDH